jgi:hypothetical protein
VIGEPGLCYGWTDVCSDVLPVPRCSINQVLGGSNCGPCAGFDTAHGTCWVNGAQWQKSNWTWACFDCPEGYIGVNLGACSGPRYWECLGHYPPNPCVSCSEPNEVLSGGPDTGWYCNDAERPPPCQRPPGNPSRFSCDLGRDMSRLVSTLNRWNTYLGAICPSTNIKSAVITGLQIGLAEANVRLRGAAAKEGPDGTVAAAQLQVDTTKIAFGLAVATVFLPIGIVPEGLALTYEGICEVQQSVGVALTLMDEFLNKMSNEEGCSPASNVQKRENIPPRGHQQLFPRDEKNPPDNSADNPCLDILAHFTLDNNINDKETFWDLTYNVKSACDDLYIYSTVEPTYSNTTVSALKTSLQICESLYRDNTTHFTLLLAFADLLKAIDGAVPYCGVLADTHNITGLSTSSMVSIHSSARVLNTTRPAVNDTSTVLGDGSTNILSKTLDNLTHSFDPVTQMLTVAPPVAGQPSFSTTAVPNEWTDSSTRRPEPSGQSKSWENSRHQHHGGVRHGHSHSHHSRPSFGHGHRPGLGPWEDATPDRE